MSLIYIYIYINIFFRYHQQTVKEERFTMINGICSSSILCSIFITNQNIYFPTSVWKCVTLLIQSEMCIITLILISSLKMLLKKYNFSIDAKRNSVWCKINWKSVITMQIWFDLIWKKNLRKDFSVCILKKQCLI